MSVSYILGYAGGIMILVAYYLTSTKKLASDSTAFQLLNFFGAVGLIVNGVTQKAWPSAILNIVWGAIAVKTLLRRAGQGRSG